MPNLRGWCCCTMPPTCTCQQPHNAASLYQSKLNVSLAVHFANCGGCVLVQNPPSPTYNLSFFLLANFLHEILHEKKNLCTRICFYTPTNRTSAHTSPRTQGSLSYSLQMLGQLVYAFLKHFSANHAPSCLGGWILMFTDWTAF